jgi:hypothetical protein
LNGHEYAKRQLMHERIAFEALDNGVLSCANPKRLQAICDGLCANKIDVLLRKWLRLLPHPFTSADRKAGYRYSISILQAEFSTTKVLDRPMHGRVFFEQVIRENLDLGRPEQVQLIFNRRIPRNTRACFRTRIVTQGVTPSLHVYYKHARIKQYHKENRALRTETTINNTYDFGGQASAQSPQAARDRFCRQSPAARNRAAEPRLHPYRKQLPGDQLPDHGRAPACLRPALCRSARSRTPARPHLIPATPQGFRAGDLRQHLAALLGCHAQAISQGAVTYQLRRLRLHRVIQRVPKSFRYEVTDFGLRVAPVLRQALQSSPAPWHRRRRP